MAASIFNSPGGGSGANRSSRYHLEFNAGRSILQNRTIVSEPAKGVIQIMTADQGVMTLYHRDRASGNLLDEAMLFPGSVKLARVEQCTTGRVYVLRFDGSSRKMFFWMQDGDSSKDAEIVAKFRELIGQEDTPQTPAPQQTQQPAAPAAAPAAATPVQSTAAAASAAAPPLIGAGLLASLLGSAAGGAGGLRPQQQQQPTGPGLGEVLAQAPAAQVFESEELQRALLPLLPEQDRSPTAAAQLLRSPPFREAVKRLNAAIHTGDAATILANFGLVVNENITNVEEFLRVIQAHAPYFSNPSSNMDTS